MAAKRILRGAALLSCALSFLAPVGAEVPTADPAHQLVSVMRLDFALLDALQWRTRLMATPAQASTAIYECLLKQDASRFKPLLAENVAATFTPSEIEAALSFYSSAAGRKFTDASLVDAHKRADPNVGETYPDIDEQEMGEIKHFFQTEVGAKLRRWSPPQGIKTLADQLVSECSGPKAD